MQEKYGKIMRGPSQKLKRADITHSNILGPELYVDKTHSISENNNRNLDYFGFEYAQGTKENIDPKENQKIFLIDNSEEIFRKIEKERAKEEQNEDLLFHDYNSISVDKFSSNSSILDFE